MSSTGESGRAGRGRQNDAPPSHSDVDPDAARPDSGEESGEDLLGDNMMADYAKMEELDRYDDRMLDNREYAGDDADARLEAERALDSRDAREGRGRVRGRDVVGMAGASGTEEQSSERFRERRKRQRKIDEQATADQTAEDELDEPFNLETYAVPLREWVEQDQTRNEIRRRFKSFLETYVDASGERPHDAAIASMAQRNGQSLPVSYLLLSQSSPVLAIWLADLPKQMLEQFDAVAREVVLSRFPDYDLIADDIHVRITQLPIADSLRDLRHGHLNALIKVPGVVTRRTGVFPQLKVVRFTCGRCGSVVGPFTQNDATEVRATSCFECQSPGPFTLNHELTVYRNYQKLTIQESPGSVPAGRVPRTKDVILLADLIDCARPGEEVEVTGVYANTYDAALNIRQGFPVFTTVIEANYVAKRDNSLAGFNVTDDDRATIEKLSRQPGIVQRLARSIAPSIYGNDNVKMAVALSMFGGREKNVDNKHRIRGDINVLLLGDPGTAKSQVLKYVEKTAPRAVYTTGKGASAVGLTAAVHKDVMTGEWTLEGGALVLADQGVCLIDEFDKMNDQDRTSIHEAMEQQSISISKAGIVATLNARCAVMAAANPIGGRYDVSKTFSENVELTDPILTRFDILCVLRDEADAVLDEKLATFVVDSHARMHPAARARNEKAAAAATAAAASGASGGSPAAAAAAAAAAAGGPAPFDVNDEATLIPQDLLRKYIVHAKSVSPSLTRLDQDKVAQLYADLRKESEVSNGIPVAVRHIESIIRMTEASARMRLAPSVDEEDLNLAIRVMLDSFITAQKFAVKNTLRRQFARYLNVSADYSQLLLVKLRELLREKQALAWARGGGAELRGFDRVDIRASELEDRAGRHGIGRDVLQRFLDGTELASAGFVYDAGSRVISRDV